MAKQKEPANPFYILLVLVGIAFCVTACAYGVMTVKGLHAAEAPPNTSGEQLMAWLDANGFRLMLIELAALATLTVAAIGMDEHWSRKASLRQSPPEKEPSNEGQPL